MIANTKRQITNAIMMVRPARFGLNPQTAMDNHFQLGSKNLSPDQIQDRALVEFDNLVTALRKKSIQVMVVESDQMEDTPDSIFPNNWVSFHADGRVALFPMYTENRRKERRVDILKRLVGHEGYAVSSIVDYSHHEQADRFLEGTGSMVLDRESRRAYAALSNRTDISVLNQFCQDFDFEPITFSAYSTLKGQRHPIYHTNVMMNIGIGFAVICDSSIDDLAERSRVIQSLKHSGKEVVVISEDQNANFAGNMLQLENPRHKRFLVMSTRAYKSLKPDQISTLEGYNQIIHSPLNIIEDNGGGSARCMIAEIFLLHQN